MSRSTLCPCHSGRTLGRCCGPFEHIPDSRPSTDPLAIHRSFRNHLIALIRDSAALMELWFAFLEHWSGNDDPSETPMDSGLLDHFLWDWFQRYPEARPICRVAQAMEGVDLPMSSHIATWIDSPLEPWELLDADGIQLRLRRINGSKEIQALAGFPLARLKPGDALLGRILPHRGFKVLGLGAHRLPGAKGVGRLKSLHAKALESRGLSPSVTLRPDVHSGLWFSVHDEWIRSARGIPPLRSTETNQPTSPPNADLDLEISREELAGQSARQAATHELGRLRLRKWAATLPAAERVVLEGLIGG